MSTSENIRVIDELFLFNGALDRYDWKIQGKKEMLVSYNNENMREHLSKEKIAGLLTPHHPNPELTRYERHRVWRVRATLKPGMRHIYHEALIKNINNEHLIFTPHHIDPKHTRFERHRVWVVQALPGFHAAIDAFYDFRNKRYFTHNFRIDSLKIDNQPLNVEEHFNPKNIQPL